MGTLYPCSSSVPITTYSDAWHRNALGPTAETVWGTLLAEGEATTKKLAALSGRDTRTIHRALNKLRVHGLAETIGAGFWIAEPADHEYLQNIAAIYGTLGAREKRKIKYQNERASRASKLIKDQKNRWEQQHAQINAVLDDICIICNFKQK